MQISEYFLEMLRATQLLYGALHIVMSNDIVEVLLVHLTVVKCESDTVDAETSSSTDSMEVCLGIRCSSLTIEGGGNIIINDELRLKNVNTSGEHVGSNKHVDLLVAELPDGFITLLICHVGEHEIRCETLLSKFSMHGLGKLLGVHEDECLRHLTSLEDFLDEIELLTRLALHSELLHIRELQLLVFHLDLLCHRDDLGDALLNLLVESRVINWIGGRKEHPLDVSSTLDVFGVRNLEQGCVVLVIQEEHVGLVNDEAFEARQVEGLATRDSSGNFTMRGDDNLGRLDSVRVVGERDASALDDLRVDGRNLVTKFARVHNNEHLSPLIGAIDSES